MTWQKTRSVLISLLTVCVILGISVAVIAYGRGYRLDHKNNSLKPTGLVSATSDPVGAQILVNGTLKTATNNSFNVDPGWYTIAIRKEGFIPWQKKLRVQGEVVTRADAFLFPTSPSLSPLTTSGLLSPTLSPDGTKIAYFIVSDTARDGVKKTGMWVLELIDRPLGRNRDPKLVAELPLSFPFTTASMTWAPDNTKILLMTGATATIYDTASGNTLQQLNEATLPTLLSDWQDETRDKDRQKLAAFKQPIVDSATSSARIIAFSPDETKMLYEATASATLPLVSDPPLIGTNTTQEERTIEKGKLYVYDSREDKNYFLLDTKELPKPKTAQPTKAGSPTAVANGSLLPVMWFPTSRHLIVIGNGKIDVLEYDRTNWATLYSGPFVDGFIAPWPNGSRLVILTNLNPGASTLPNLYTVNLR